MKLLLNSTFSVREAVEQRPQVPVTALFEFQPGREDVHLESAVLRYFKDLKGPGLRSPLAYVLTALFLQSAGKALERRPITHVCRILSSWETRPSPDAPLERFSYAVASSLDAQFMNPVRRTSAREPMRFYKRLSGRECLEARLRYAAQDLIFEFDGNLQDAHVLVIDDIRCLGASELVWSWALRRAGAASVHSLALGQTAELGEAGGALCGGLSELASAVPAKTTGADLLRPSWLETSQRVMHQNRGCALMTTHAVPWLSGLKGGVSLCQGCSSGDGRRWWSFR